MLYTRKMTFFALITVLLVHAGCTPAVQTTPMAIDKTRYDPAVARYPASVGVYFPDDFFENNFYHETRDGHHHTFHNNPADATRRAVVLALEKTFAEVQYLETLQEGLAAEDFAFVVVPNIVSMVADLSPEVIAVMVVYRFDFFVDDALLHSWRITGVDSVSRENNQAGSSFGLFRKKDAQSKAISAERFDEVARGAVWDATSVLLTELDHQTLLTDRLPESKVNGTSVQGARKSPEEPAVLAMVGPLFDQNQVPEKQRLEACMIEEIKDNGLSLQAVSLYRLQDQLYPWFTRSNYPRRLNELQLIVKQPAVKERLLSLGIQYLLNWDGETTLAAPEGDLYMTPYGVIGYESTDKKSVIKADLLAVEEGKVVNSFEIMSEGTELMLGLVFMPLPIFSDTEEDACEELTRQIETFIQANAQPQEESR